MDKVPKGRLGDFEVGHLPWQFKLPKILLVIAGLFFLQGCAVELISSYDEPIDKGVTEFNENFLKFTAQMNQKARTPAGTYQSNITYYDTWNAKLETLKIRAIARAPTQGCSGKQTFKGLMPQGLAAFEATASSGTEESAQGDCTAILLALLEEQFRNFAAFHEAQGAIGIPAQARAPVELIEINVRSIMYVELAKKRNLGG